MKIGTQIQALRKQQGITQETLAAEMGVTVGAVSKWENGLCQTFQLRRGALQMPGNILAY